MRRRSSIEDPQRQPSGFWISVLLWIPETTTLDSGVSHWILMTSLGLIFASGFQALDFGRFDVLWISTTSALDSRRRRREKLEEMRRSPFLALKWRRVSSTLNDVVTSSYNSICVYVEQSSRSSVVRFPDFGFWIRGFRIVAGRSSRRWKPAT